MPILSDRKSSPEPVAPVVLADPFLSSAKWSAGASSALREAARCNDPAAFSKAWRELHAGPAAKLPNGLCLWSLVEGHTDDPIVRLTYKVFSNLAPPKSRGRRAAIKSSHPLSVDRSQLVSLLVQKLEPWSPTETITAGELLVNDGKSLEPAQIWSLWSRLAAESQRKATSELKETPDQLVLRSGEAPFLTGLLLEPWREAKPLREQGRRQLVDELIAQTDSDGTPHAELLPRLPLWLAPLVRATLWAERFGVPLWSDDDRRRLSLVLERSIPLCRPNGRLAMGNGYALPAIPLFDAAAKALSLTGPAEKLLRTLKHPPEKGPLRKQTSRGIEIMPSSQSDWARFAMLRSNWHSHADSLAISHHQPQPLLDVAALGTPVLHGPWAWELQIADAGIEPADEWSCSCWFSDPDADYLELQMKGPGALRVERQVLLSRKDHFLLLADCVRGAQSVLGDANDVGEQRIHLRTRLSLAHGVTAEADVPTREIRLKAGKQAVRVFPLALVDDRVQSTPHECRIDGGDLVLHQVGQGNGLYAPLIFDWHPDRIRRPALWRTLTVSEAGKPLGKDLAAGHRLQLGKHQLLIYRSFSPIHAARAVLGHHTWHESVVAKFDGHGDVEPIVKVEG